MYLTIFFIIICNIISNKCIKNYFLFTLIFIRLYVHKKEQGWISKKKGKGREKEREREREKNAIKKLTIFLHFL